MRTFIPEEFKKKGKGGWKPKLKKKEAKQFAKYYAAAMERKRF